MSVLSDRIAEVLRGHTPSDIGFCSATDCTWRYWPGSDHAAHVAERIEADLQLTEETNAHYGDRYTDDSPATHRRWVMPYEEIPS